MANMLEPSATYTRNTLEGLRRSELQKLFKAHNLKGANGTTATLIDTLFKYFASISNDVEANSASPSSQTVARISPQRSMKMARNGLSKKGKEKAISSGLHDRGEEAILTQAPATYITSEQVEHLLHARDAVWESRLDVLAKSMGEVQERLEGELRQVREALEEVRHKYALLEADRVGRRLDSDRRVTELGTVQVQVEGPTPPRPSESVLGKHSRSRSVEPLMTDEELELELEPELDEDSNEAKRVRFGGTSTPPPLPIEERERLDITPRTPPPASQGIRTEQWRTPRSSTWEEHLNQHHGHGKHSATSSLSSEDDDEDADRIPEFSGTPKPPTERPFSPTPTMERFPSSSSDKDINSSGRGRRAESIPLAAVTDLERIEEGKEIGNSPFARRAGIRAAPKQRLSGLLGPPAQIRRRADSERPDISSRLTSGPGGSRNISLPSRGASTPPRRAFTPTLIPTEYESTLPGGGIRSASADYMHVAMHGINQTPQRLAGGRGSGANMGIDFPVTPGHRTLLGTERYNDTRFGDIPVGGETNWDNSPRVDWLGGPETPL